MKLERFQFRKARKTAAWFVVIAVLLCILADVQVTSNPAEHERNLRAKEEDLIRKMSQRANDCDRAKVTVDQQATDMKAGRK
jgi:hypothetical protein